MIIGIDGSHSGKGKTYEALASIVNPARIIKLSEVSVDVAVATCIDPNNQAIVFATPVHWFNVSSLMKQFIDTLPKDDYPLEGKVAAFIAVCNEDGAQQAINSMVAPLNFMGMVIPPFAFHFINTSMNGGEDGWQNDLLALKMTILDYKNATKNILPPL